jgi:acetyltransferase-like isoleucine patch superfamily enzyme
LRHSGSISTPAKIVRKLTESTEYHDDLGNSATIPPDLDIPDIEISFRGSNNHLHIDQRARLRRISIDFRGSNARVKVGACSANLTILIGSESTITIGDGLSTTGSTYMSAFEGSSISIGTDCMFAGGIQIRADDAHPIFNTETGRRLNHSRPIIIDDHVWLCEGVVILNGSHIGAGSVIGTRSVVKGKIGNNCVAAGVPARVTRRNAVWERPHLSQESLFTPEGTLKDPSGNKMYWNQSGHD